MLSLATNYQKELPQSGERLKIPTEKYTPIPEGYQFSQYGAKPTPTTRLVSLPTTVGGQFISDPKQPGVLIKSSEERVFEPGFNRQARNGLPSWLFEIDHVMPLWAGGADTEENKQRLLVTDHDKKNKVETIARVLYYNNKLSLNGARALAMGWKDKRESQLKGITLDENGDVPLDLAEEKLLEWQKPPKVGWSEFWDELKGGSKGIAGEFAQGAASGLTMGYIPAKEHEYETSEESTYASIARGAGQIAGTLVNFAILKGLGGVAAKALGLANVAKASSATAIAAKTAATAATATKALRISPSAKIGEALGKIAVPGNRGLRTLENIGLFTIHGQLSKQEENTFGERVKRFMSDASFGTITGLAGQTLKSYAGLGAGTYALSVIEGDNPADAFINTAIVTGLHGMGKVGNKARLEKAADNIALNYRQQVFEKYAPGQFKTKPAGLVYSAEEINNENKKIIRQILDKADTPEEVKEEINKLLLAGRQLYKGGLSTEQRLKEDIADLTSITKKISIASRGELENAPTDILDFFKNNTKIFSNSFVKEPSLIAGREIPKNLPTGRMQMTGISEGVSPKTAKNIRNFIKGSKKKIQAGEEDGATISGDRIILVRRDDQAMVDLIKAKNTGLPADDPRTYKHPENNIEIWGYRDGQFYQLGMWPRRERIGYTQSMRARTAQGESMDFAELPNSINQNVHQRYGGVENDPYFDKNAVADAMRTTGVKFLPATVDIMGERALKSKQPWGSIDVTSKDWETAMEINRLYKSPVQKTITKVKETVQKAEENLPASEIISLKFKDKGGNLNFKNFLATVEEWINSGNPKTIKDGLGGLGITISDATADIMAKNPNSIKVGRLIEKMRYAKATGKLSNDGENFYELSLSENTFYSRLKTTDKEYIDSLPLGGQITTPIVQQKLVDTLDRLRLKKTSTEPILASKTALGDVLALPEGKITTPAQTTPKSEVNVALSNRKINQQITEERKSKVTSKDSLANEVKLEQAKNKAPEFIPKNATPETEVPVYRASKTGIKSGDEITLSKKKAEDYATKREDAKVFEEKAKLKDLSDAGGLSHEFIYKSPSIIKTTPIAKEAISIYNLLKETGKNNIDNILTPTQESGNLSKGYVIDRVLATIDNLRFSSTSKLSSKALKQAGLDYKKIEKIEKQAKDELLVYAEDTINTRFNPDAELEVRGVKKPISSELEVKKTSATPENKEIDIYASELKLIKDQVKRKLGLPIDIPKNLNEFNVKSDIYKFYKQLEKTEKAKEAKIDFKAINEQNKIILELLGKKNAPLPFANEVKSKIEEGKKSDNSNTRVFNSILDKLFQKTFGAKTKGDYTKNYFFNTLMGQYGSKSNKFWKNISSEENIKGFLETSPPETVLKRYEALRKRFSKGEYLISGEKLDKEFREVYGRAKKQSVEEEAQKFEQELPSKQALEEANIGKEDVATGSIKLGRRFEDVLLNELDRTMFPAMVGVEQRGISYKPKDAVIDAVESARVLNIAVNQLFPKANVPKLNNKIIQEVVESVIGKTKKINIKDFESIRNRIKDLYTKGEKNLAAKYSNLYQILKDKSTQSTQK